MTVTDTANSTDDRVRNLKYLYEKARKAKRNRYDTWTRNWRLVHNRVGGNAVEAWMPTPRTSEVYPICSNIVAWANDQHTNISIAAAASPHSDYGEYIQELAMDLGNVINAVWDANHFSAQTKLCIWDSLIYGVGVFKTTWDQNLDDGMGQVCLKRVDPWTLYVDPKCTSFEDAEYIIEARLMSPDEVERRFPGNREAITAGGRVSGTTEIDQAPRMHDQVGGSNDGGIAPLNTQTSQGAGVFGYTSGGPGDGRNAIQTNRRRGNQPTRDVVVYEFWTKENEEWWEDKTDIYGKSYSVKHVAPIWRVTCVCNDEVLLDAFADDLWSHQSHPYSRFAFDDIGEFYGISLVDHLAFPQVYINRLLAAMQMNAELCGNPVFVENEQMGISRQTIVSKPGQRIQMRGTNPNDKPMWLQPPPMPSQVQDLIQFWLARMQNVAGISEAMKGQNRQGPGRTTEQTMSTIQEVAFVRIRSFLANMEEGLEDASQKMCDIIIDNYDQPRMMAVCGPEGRESSIALRGRHFMVPTPHGASPLKYTIAVDAGAAEPTSLQARQSRELQLFQMGATDDEALLQALNYQGYQEVIDRKYEKMQEGLFTPPGARQRRQQKPPGDSQSGSQTQR
jgi:hypothetical protein